MFDDLFGELDAALSGFVESDIFQIGIRVLVIYILLIWLASAFWAYRDMRQRTSSALAPYVAAATIIIFTPIFFLFGLLLYRIVRPKETIAEVNERTLAEEAILAEVASHAQCANCSRPVHEDWIICPTCRNRLRRVCPNCERLIELDWTLCAWCGKDFERAEAPGTAYMPTARPAARPPQIAQRVPPPPAPARAPQSATTSAAPGATPPSRPQRGSAAPQGSTSPSPAPRSSQATSSSSSGGSSSATAKPSTGAQASTGI